MIAIPGAAMLQITDWLARLTISECVQCFTENRIDFSILPDLTDQDLEKLGIILGDRRKMLRAIADLKPFQSTPAASEATEVSAGPPSLDICRAPSGNGDVLGPRLLHSTLRQDGP